MKIAAHVHSDWSYDGSYGLRDIARIYRELGYDAVMMSEHDTTFDQERWVEYQVACENASTSDIFLVPGLEYSDPENTVHILVWGESIPFLGKALPTEACLQSAKAAGGICILAHPTRKNAWSRYRPSWTPMLDGIEVWNRKTDGIAPSREAHRILLETGLPWWAGHDFHRKNQLYPLAMRSTRRGQNPADVIRMAHDHQLQASAFGLPVRCWTSPVLFCASRGADGVRRSLAAVRHRAAARLQPGRRT